MIKFIISMVAYLFFPLYATCTFGSYIESTEWNVKEVILQQDGLKLKVHLSVGPSGYRYTIIQSDCSTSADVRYAYFILPKHINMNGNVVNIAWVGTPKLYDFNDEWAAYGVSGEHGSSYCQTVGSTNIESKVRIGPTIDGEGWLGHLPVGSYPVSMKFYTGNAFGATFDEAKAQIAKYGFSGASSNTPNYPFEGLAECDNTPTERNLDFNFGVINSNGKINPGPMMSSKLSCNFDADMNSVDYMLKSLNPVDGKPIAGKDIYVRLTNGAAVNLKGSSLKKILQGNSATNFIVDISSSIDTSNAIAGEGNGSATLTFSYP